MSANRYYYLKARGLCVKCGKNHAHDGKTLCLVCLMDRRERDRERSREKGRTEEQREKDAERMRALRERRKAEGLCVMCTTRKATEGRIMCDQCRAKVRERQRRALDGKRVSDLGGCPRCGKDPVEGYKLCADCLPKAQSAMLHARKHKRTRNYFETLQEREHEIRANASGTTQQIRK